MKNYIKPGEKITVTATAAVASGDGVMVEDMFGVAEDSAAIGEDFTLMRTGEFDLPAGSAITANQGAKAYWLNSGAGVTDSATASKEIGLFTLAKANGETKARVVLKA